MKRLLFFLLLLSAGVAASAWMGMVDSSAPSPDSAGASASARTANSSYLRRSQTAGVGTGSRTAYASPAPMPAARIYGPEQIYRSTRTLLPLAQSLGQPRAGDWRARIREPEQNFVQYIQDADSRQARGTLLIQPIGNLPKDHKLAIGHMLEGISAFYGMPAVCAAPIPLAQIPRSCFRTFAGIRQINAEAVMQQLLAPQVTGGVVGMLAITTLDLYPGERWPFDTAHGWSSFNNGTAILSTRAILAENRADRGKNLLRMVKLSIHELAHTFNLKHCSKYICLMNGAGDLRESDSKPLALCPDCLAKISLATGRDPREHLEAMLVFCRAKGFSAEARYYAKTLQMIN